MRYSRIIIISLSGLTMIANAGTLEFYSQILFTQPLSGPTLTCGEKNADPTAILWDSADREPPLCNKPRPRQYVPKYKGLAYDILDFESEACFVPDVAYQILDDIISKVLERVTAAKVSDSTQNVLLISRTTSDVLSEMGFALWIPTVTLSDTMFQRRNEAEKFRHVFDCDTGAMILLTIADVLGIKAFLVESTIPSRSDPQRIVHHSFVSWPVSSEQIINWDMNARRICRAPISGQLPYQGKNLTKQQLWGYEIFLRAQLWERGTNYDKALHDYRQAMKDFPEHLGAYNGFAWIVATKKIANRREYIEDALDAAQKASAAREDGNMLDTLACVYAYQGDFKSALETEEHAIKVAPAESLHVFERRRDKFRSGIQNDCTGE
jgi:tetratricopeptide (TPR) repeat protein